MTDGRVVYVCQTFPWVTQAFTVREVAVLREQGLDVHVVSFRRPDRSPPDEAGRRLLPHTTYLPGRGLVLLGPLLRAAARHPRVVLGHLLAALASRGVVSTTWTMRARDVLAVARGAWIAANVPARLYHADFADEAATAAMVAGDLAGRPFSFKNHSCFNAKQLARKSGRAAFVAAETEFDRGHYFGEVPDARVLVNRGGVVGPAAAKPPPPGACLRILCIATLQEKKGQAYLLDALRLLREREVAFRCLLVGSGPLESRLRNRASEHRLEEQVEFRPYVSQDEVGALYRGHDVLALPCVVAADGDRDGLPNVLIEAAAAGCALVSTPVSGIPELVEDGVTGLLVPERDAEALAGALARLAAEPDLRAELARAAQQLVRERFDLYRNVAELGARFRVATGAEALPEPSTVVS